MEYKFSVALTDDDYLAYNKFHMTTHPAGKRLLTKMRIAIPIVFLVVFAVIGIVQKDTIPPRLLGILWVVASVYGIVSAKRLTMRATKKNLKRMKEKGVNLYSKASTITCDDEYITEVTPETEVKKKLSTLKQIYVAQTAVYIYMEESRAFLIPLRAFPDEQTRVEFTKFIQQKIAANSTATQ
ncbi:MAG: YcxB family protein [Oscillospiraceae bacterium]|jgi:hypothetical protein|nr:YcxB family protein [Oscillospiraceae bacterium]